MTKKQLAAELGISPPYFSLIYHGRTTISQAKYDSAAWMEKTRRTLGWWKSANLSDVQKVFNRLLREVNLNGKS